MASEAAEKKNPELHLDLLFGYQHQFGLRIAVVNNSARKKSDVLYGFYFHPLFSRAQLFWSVFE